MDKGVSTTLLDDLTSLIKVPIIKNMKRRTLISIAIVVITALYSITPAHADRFSIGGSFLYEVPTDSNFTFQSSSGIVNYGTQSNNGIGKTTIPINYSPTFGYGANISFTFSGPFELEAAFETYTLSGAGANVNIYLPSADLRYKYDIREISTSIFLMGGVGYGLWNYSNANTIYSSDILLYQKVIPWLSRTVFAWNLGFGVEIFVPDTPFSVETAFNYRKLSSDNGLNVKSYCISAGLRLSFGSTITKNKYMFY